MWVGGIFKVGGEGLRQGEIKLLKIKQKYFF